MGRTSLLALVLAAALLVAGCGRDDGGGGGDRPALSAGADQPRAAENLGFPTFATKNTTRVAGADATATAAAVARAVFPDGARRPKAIALVDAGDWRSALAASVLMADPIRAPLLYSEGTDLPKASRETLSALNPAGNEKVGNGALIRIGATATVAGRKSTDVRGANPYARARAILGLVTAARDKPPGRVLIVSADDAGMAAPAAGFAAKAGVPILFAHRNRLPPETRDALEALDRPQIMILGPSKLISPRVAARLRKFGEVSRTGGKEPVTNSIEFARFRVGDFGWGIGSAGHGFVFLRAGRPLDAAAAAPLSASGSYGPQVMLDAPDRLTRETQQYLLDVQPGFRTDPAAATFNHGWIIGDLEAISAPVQARIDVLLEIVPERINGADPIAPEDRR
jgi:predicted small secreted protein